MSQVSTLLVTSFVRGSWDPPEDIPDGCRLGHQTMEEIMGHQLKPIQQFQQCNYDMTSTYVWDGKEDWKEHKAKWKKDVRVSKETQDKGRRNKKTPTTQGEEQKCNGLSVKWCQGASAAGHLFPMVAIFSGFSKREMPGDGFTIQKIEDMSIGSHLDPRCGEAGYVALLRDMQSMF